MRIRARLTLSFALLALPVAGAEARETAAAGTRFVADGGIVGSPVITDDGAVYCVTDARSLIRVDADAGFRWNAPLHGMPTALFPKRDGVLLVCLEDGRMEIRTSGGGKGPIFRTGPGRATAVFETADGRILAGDSSGGFGLFTPGGLRLVSWNLDGRPSSLPVFGGDDLVACAISGGGIEVRRATGTSVARIQTAFEASELLRTETGDYAAAGKDGSLGLYSSAGAELGRKSFASPVVRLLSIPGGGFAALTAEGEVIFFDAMGSVRRSHDSGEAALGAASDGSGIVYVAGRKGGLRAFSEEGPLFSDPAVRFLSAPVVSDGGDFLAAGGSDWVLHVFEIVRYRSGEGGPLRAPPRKGRPPATGQTPIETRFAHDLDLIYLSENARSGFPSRRVRVLDELEGRLAGANFGKSAEYASLPLRLLAAGDLSAAGRQRSEPSDRLRAIRLLGLLGSGYDRGFLIGLLGREADEAARAEIIRALGELRSDPAGASRRAVCNACAVAALPVFVAEAAVGALEKIRAYQGGPLLPEEAGFLERIFSGGYGRDLESRAEELGKAR